MNWADEPLNEAYLGRHPLAEMKDKYKWHNYLIMFLVTLNLVNNTFLFERLFVRIITSGKFSLVQQALNIAFLSDTLIIILLVLSLYYISDFDRRGYKILFFVLTVVALSGILVMDLDIITIILVFLTLSLSSIIYTKLFAYHRHVEAEELDEEENPQGSSLLSGLTLQKATSSKTDSHRWLTTTHILMIFLIFLVSTNSYFATIPSLIDPYMHGIQAKGIIHDGITLVVPGIWNLADLNDTADITPSNKHVYVDQYHAVRFSMSVFPGDYNSSRLHNFFDASMNNSASRKVILSSFLSKLQAYDPCRDVCKNDVTASYQINQYLNSDAIVNNFKACVPECKQKQYSFSVEESFTSSRDVRGVLLENGLFLVGDAIIARCKTPKIVYLEFYIDRTIVPASIMQAIHSRIIDSIKCVE